MHKLGYGPKKSKPTKSIEKDPDGASEEPEVANGQGLSYDEPDLVEAPQPRKHHSYGINMPSGDIMMSKPIIEQHFAEMPEEQKVENLPADFLALPHDFRSEDVRLGRA